jgi:acylpyruvate hydrolase
MSESIINSISSSLYTGIGPKILCIAKNYFEHAIEMGATDVPPYPIIFQKPITSVISEGQNIVIPNGVEVHHEIELAILIGKQGRNISIQSADDYIAGYGLALDMTARNLQAEAKKNAWPWDVSKGFDTFLPLSKFLDKAVVGNPYELQLELFINGVSKQRGSTGAMHYKGYDIISYISNVMTLKPGDLILTGTPAGVGPVNHGDVLESYLRRGEETLIQTRFQVD